MSSNIKNRFKSVYSELIKLRENVINSKKILNFKKLKWKKYVHYVKKTYKRYIKFKSLSQIKYSVAFDGTNKWTSYQRGKFRQILYSYKRFNLFYGGFNKKKIKSFIKKIVNKNFKNNLKLMFLKFFESRLDVVLYRAKFITSIQGARQLISHGKIKINNIIIRNKDYILIPGDLISINLNFKNKLIKKGIVNNSKVNVWPIPPKHLVINYKTLQIIFQTIDNDTTNFSTHFTFNLNVDKLKCDYLRQ